MSRKPTGNAASERKSEVGVNHIDSSPVKFKNSSAENLDEFARIHPAVDATLMQLDPGIFCGETAFIDLHDVLLVRRKSNLRYFSMGVAPEHIYFSFPLSAHGAYFRRNFQYGDTAQIAYHSTVGGVSIVPANFEQIWVAVKLDSLGAYLSDEKIQSMVAMFSPDNKIIVSKIHKEIATSFVRKIHVEIGRTPKNKLSSHRYCELIISYLWAYIESSRGEPVAKENSSSYEKIFDRTTRFLYRQAGKRCSLARLSTEVFASKRNIQYAFSQIVNMSPMEFSRLVKLNLLKTELLKLNSGESISPVLGKYHVSNPGRFRHEYFGFFKEYPRETAARNSV